MSQDLSPIQPNLNTAHLEKSLAALQKVIRESQKRNKRKAQNLFDVADDESIVEKIQLSITLGSIPAIPKAKPILM